MIPEKDQNITVVFKNSIQIEGVVVSWTDQKSVIKSLSGSSHIVIQKTLEDVMFYKITSVKQEFKAAISKPIHKEDIPHIAELKKELNKIEVEEIQEKLKEHTASSMEVKYGNPTIQGIKQCPAPQITRKNTDISSGLSNLFSKKH